MPAYLDNSATTRPTEGVVTEMARAMREEYWNPSSMYAPALAAEKEMDACREKILGALRARDARVVFTSGGTEANNLAILGATGALRPPIRVAVSCVEHPSVLEAAKRLKEAGAEVTLLPVNGEGALVWEALEAALQNGLSLVSCMQVNNETGARLDARRLWETVRGRSPSTLIHIDGVQGFLREEMDCKYADLYTLSGHKIHGPKGVGALVARKSVRLKPLLLGGGQEQALRSGTENTPGIIGLSRAIDEMLEIGNARESLMEKKLRLIDALRQGIPEACVNGPAPEDAAAHIVNMSFPGVRAEVLLHALEEKRVYVSTGSACSSRKRHVSAVLTAMGVPPARAESALRFSLSPHTTTEELEFAARAVCEQYEILKRYQRR